MWIHHFCINSECARPISSSTVCIPPFVMPPKIRKNAITSAVTSAPSQGQMGQRMNVAEVIAYSGDEFEHLAVKSEDRYI